MDLVVASYNVAGLGNAIKRKSVWYFLKSSPVHIVFLQETHAYSACETLWETEWGGNILWNHGTRLLVPKVLQLLLSADCNIMLTI